jgi:hypothetical protein
MSSQGPPVLRIRVHAEADPGALARVLERFQNLNIIPRRVAAEVAPTGCLRVRVDIVGVCEGTVGLIAAKLGQVPCIIDVTWNRVRTRPRTTRQPRTSRT